MIENRGNLQLRDVMIRDIGKFTHGFAGMKAGDGVIDICSGTGTRVLEYARNSIIVVGIDSSLDMLKTAKRNKARQKALIGSFQFADAGPCSSLY